MERLLNLSHSLASDNSFFLKYRNSSSVDPSQLKKLVYGPNFAERDRVFASLTSHPAIFQHYHLTEASRKHQREQTNKQFMFAKNELKEMVEKGSKNPNLFTLYGNGFCFYDMNLITKMGVHYSLYLKTLQRLGTTPLHDYYYRRACKYEDFGCFALTQLMHGSNVKGMMTEAHYDHSSKELVIHSPSKDAIKFWIGGAAKTSNMTIVWAQLYIRDQCHGVHAIVVPLRDQETHKVLPGITIGDCGPKFGLNGVDNGFIEFNRFRVPVGNLLNRVSGIDEKGEFFSKAPSEGKRFGTTLAALSEGRLFMCCHSSTSALCALAIAIRYTFVRKQFTNGKGQKENYLFEYPLTHRRMIPLLAQETVLMCVTMSTFHTAENNQDKSKLSPNDPLLQEIHAISSVLKARTTWAATQVIRECRQMMGGHGYSAFSKMAALYSNNDVNNTWEGENHVLLQQTTKYVLQNFQRAMAGKPVPSPLLKFLQNPPEEQPFEVTAESIVNFQLIRKYLRSQVLSKVQELGMRMMEMKERKLPFLDIWNQVQVYTGQKLAHYTVDLYILDLCLHKLTSIQHERTRQVFEDCLHVWTLLMLKGDQAINEEDYPLIQTTLMGFCEKLIPEVLGILQSIVAGEEVLGSPFADQQGGGFDKYLELLMKQPRNQRASYWETVASK